MIQQVQDFSETCRSRSSKMIMDKYLRSVSPYPVPLHIFFGWRSTMPICASIWRLRRWVYSIYSFTSLVCHSLRIPLHMDPVFRLHDWLFCYPCLQNEGELNDMDHVCLCLKREIETVWRPRFGIPGVAISMAESYQVPEIGNPEPSHWKETKNKALQEQSG